MTVGDENKKLTGSDSLEKLERFLKISNNLVFETNWEKLDKESYSDLSKFLLRIFGVKIPDRESLTFLKEFPIKLPPLNAETLTPKGELPVSTDEIKLFSNILDRSNLENVMENIIFLEKKNYEVVPCTNGADAVRELITEYRTALDTAFPGN